MLVSSVMLHTILSKRKVVLDQLCKGLETLNLLEEVRKRPLVFESLFVQKPGSVTSEKVKESLSFNGEPLDQRQQDTRGHLFKFLDECTEKGMGFDRFVSISIY